MTAPPEKAAHPTSTFSSGVVLIFPDNLLKIFSCSQMGQLMWGSFWACRQLLILRLAHQPAHDDHCLLLWKELGGPEFFTQAGFSQSSIIPPAMRKRTCFISSLFSLFVCNICHLCNVRRVLPSLPRVPLKNKVVAFRLQELLFKLYSCWGNNFLSHFGFAFFA